MQTQKLKLLIGVGIILFALISVAIYSVIPFHSFTSPSYTPTPTYSIVVTPLPAPITTFLPSQNPNKKIFRNVTAGFELEVPEGWTAEGGVLKALNSYYSINFSFTPAETYSFSQQKNISFSDPLLYEQAVLDNINQCQGCTDISNFKEIRRNGIVGVNYETRYSKNIEGKDIGFIGHYLHEIYIVNAHAYDFWAFQAEQPNNFWIDRYPQTHPTPLELFDQVMSTLKFI